MTPTEHPGGKPAATDERPVPAGIVLHRPEPALLAKLLAALDTPGRRLLLFVNGALSDDVETRLAQLADVATLRSSSNVGLGAGLNALCEQAMREGFAHLLLFDQDSQPDADLPRHLVDRMARETATGARLAVCAPRLTVPEGGHFRAIRYDWLDRAKGLALFAPTSGSLLSLAAFRAVGPFRADFFIGGIDVEWGLRATRKGYRSLIAGDLEMPHRWGTPATKPTRWRPQILRHSPLRNYYYLRNAIACLRLTTAPRGWRLRYGGNLLAQIAVLVMFRGLDPGSRKAVLLAFRDGFSGRFGPAPRDIPADG